MELGSDKWTAVLDPIWVKYNLSKHESTEMESIDRENKPKRLLIERNVHGKAKKDDATQS